MKSSQCAGDSSASVSNMIERARARTKEVEEGAKNNIVKQVVLKFDMKAKE